MIKAKSLAGAATIALAATGCTTSLSTRADLTRTSDRAVAMTGLVYHLPMLQYEISVKRTLSHCPAADDGTDASIDKLLEDPNPEIGFAAVVEVKPRYVRGESYVVDYRSLTAGTKTTSFTLEPYAITGNLKSVNVSAEDHTAGIIKDVAKVALVGVSFAAAGPGAAAAAAAAVTPPAGPADVAQKNAPLTPRRNDIPDEQKENPLSPRLAAASDEADVEELIRAHLGTLVMIDCNAEARAQIVAAVKAAAALKSEQIELDRASGRVEDAAILVGIRGVGVIRKEQYALALESALADLATKTAALDAAKAVKDDTESELSRLQTSTFPTRFDLDDEVFHSTAAAAAYEGVLAVRRRRVVDADGLAQALAALRIRIGPARYDAAIAHRKSLKGYLTAEGTAKTFKAKDEDIARRIREVRSSPDRARLLAMIGTHPCNPGIPELGSPEPKINACLAEKLAISAVLQSAEPVPAMASRDFPTLAGRTDLTAAGAGATLTPGKAAPELVHARNGGAHAGLFIRPPVRGELIVCQKSTACDAEDARLFVAGPKDPPTYVPQLGQLRFLPFKNPIFAYNEMMVQLEPDGSLSRFEYKNKKAVAAEFAATAADVASQIDAARTKTRAEAKDDRTAKIEELQYEIDSIAKTKALKEARTVKPVDPLDTVMTETVALDAKAALANAKLARLKAEAALIAYSQSGGN